jgi:hypothetical protein
VYGPRGFYTSMVLGKAWGQIKHEILGLHGMGGLGMRIEAALGDL